MNGQKYTSTMQHITKSTVRCSANHKFGLGITQLGPRLCIVFDRLAYRFNLNASASLTNRFRTSLSQHQPYLVVNYCDFI